MQNYSIKDRCHICTNIDTDSFVGIECVGSSYTINFPLGFEYSQDEKQLRREILLMMNSIALTTKKRESVSDKKTDLQTEEGFPIQAYLYLISNYLEYGYYKEKEIRYQVANRGKISWNKTIKTQKPIVDGTNAYYLSFVTRKNPVSENELITQIHGFCVYDSFEKMGWLFTSSMPEKPRIKLNKKLFSTVLREKLQSTNNDNSRILFRSMLAVIKWLNDPEAPVNFRYGTSHYEYVWEDMIDWLYGIRGKSFYFPKTTWVLPSGTHDNAFLEPDTIMLLQDHSKIYVLDAKYYKYGITKKASDLPESTSINKQITYGEYIATQKKFEERHGQSRVVYNAFLMPFSAQPGEEPLQYAGEAISDWKPDCKTYERIQGILVDIKHLITVFSKEDSSELLRLADMIEAAYKMEA